VGFRYDWEDVPDIEKKTDLLKSKEHRSYMQALEDRYRMEFAVIRHPLDGVKPQKFPHCPQGNFVPQPGGPPPDIHPDILVAPRYRLHGAHRNYAHWAAVIDGLRATGFSVGLIGAKETSVDYPGLGDTRKAWTYPDNLGTTLHWMHLSQVVLTTDSAMAHLAVLAGAPLWVIYGRAGVEAGKEAWRWTIPHMRAHAVAPVTPIINGWEDPDLVVGTVKAYLESKPAPRSKLWGC
jgi:hypothetical protein